MTGFGPNTFKFKPTFPTAILKCVADNDEAVEEKTA